MKPDSYIRKLERAPLAHYERDNATARCNCVTCQEARKLLDLDRSMEGD